MTEGLLQALGVALGGVFSFGSLAFGIYLLSQANGLQKGLAYAGGYTVMYAAIGSAVAVTGSRATFDKGVVEFVFSILLTLFGSIFLFSAAYIRFFGKGRRARAKDATARAADGEVESAVAGDGRQGAPGDARQYARDAVAGGETARLSAEGAKSSLTVFRTFFVGMLVTVINIKNLMIYLAAISFVSFKKADIFVTLLSVLAVTAVFCFVVFVPPAVRLLLPGRSELALNRFKTWIDTRGETIKPVVLFVFGFLFLLRGLRFGAP